MNQLVVNHNGNPVTTSRLVAEKFGKEHKKVLRDIRSLECSEKFLGANFGPSVYNHPRNGRELPQFIMNKTGFMFLVMGFTGKEAAKLKEDYIERFEEMETTLKAQQNQLPAQTNELLEQLTGAVSKLSDKISLLESSNDRPEQVSIPTYEDYATVTQFAEEIDFPITTGEITKISNAAVMICRKSGLAVKTWEDDIYGKKYKYYPKSILHKAVSTVLSF